MSRETPPRTLPADQLRFAAVLSEAITRRNLTLERLSARLREAGTPVSIATLSYWQTGRSLPTRTKSLRAVDELERLLRVPVGHLGNALPRDVLSRWDQLGNIPDHERGNTVLRQMGFQVEHPFAALWVQDHVLVSGDQQHESTRQMMQSTRDGLEAIPLVLRQGNVPETPASIEAISGCELGRVVQLEEYRLIAAELLLPRPLAVGDLWTLGYRVTWEITGETQHGFARHLRPGVQHHVLQAEFTGRPPTAATYFTMPSGVSSLDDPRTRHQELPTGPFLQMVIPHPAPGLHGLSWDPDDEMG